MPDPEQRTKKRAAIEQVVANAVKELREDENGRNIVFRVPATGDIVVILQVAEADAQALSELLAGRP